MNKRRILLIACTMLVLIAIAGTMLVIGRGHTMYFDNKELSFDGKSYAAMDRINVYVNGERVARLSEGDRGLATFTGQSLSFDLEVTRVDDGEKEALSYTVKVPYADDGIIVNLIGLIEGLPQDAWMSKFVPAPVVQEPEEEIVIDEFDMALEEE